MRESYIIDTKLLNNFLTNLKEEYNSFTQRSSRTFSDSYLNSCSDSTIIKMKNNINQSYNKINNGYINISKWLNDYASDITNVENGLGNKPYNILDAATSMILGQLNIKDSLLKPAEDLIRKLNSFNSKQNLPLITNGDTNPDDNMELLPFNPEFDEDDNNVEFSSLYGDDLRSYRTDDRGFEINEFYDGEIPDVLVNDYGIEPTDIEYISEEEYHIFFVKLKGNMIIMLNTDVNGNYCVVGFRDETNGFVSASRNLDKILKTAKEIGYENISGIDEYGTDSVKIYTNKGLEVKINDDGDTSLEYEGIKIPPEIKISDIDDIKSVESLGEIHSYVNDQEVVKKTAHIVFKNGNQVEFYDNTLVSIIINGKEISSSEMNLLSTENISVKKVQSINSNDTSLRIKLDNGIIIDYSKTTDGNYQRHEIYVVISDITIPIDYVDKYNIDINDVSTIYINSNVDLSIRLDDGTIYNVDKYGKMVDVVIDGKSISYEQFIYDGMKDDSSNRISSDEFENIKSKIPEDKDETWALYYYRVFNNPALAKFSEQEKLAMIDKMMEFDKNNNYRIMHSTPVLYNGSTTIVDPEETSNFSYDGEYLVYYNEYGIEQTNPLKALGSEDGDTFWRELDPEEKEKYINKLNQYNADVYDEMKKYPDYYKNEVTKHLDKLVYIKYDKTYEKKWDGICWHRPVGTDSVVGIDTNFLFDESYQAEYSYKDGIGVFNHELGHAFNNSTGFWSSLNSSNEWEEIYRQVEIADPNHSLLRDYAYTNPYELWAEAIAEYYNSDGTESEYYKPSDLEKIKIDYEGYTNLYDYVDDVVNGRRVY